MSHLWNPLVTAQQLEERASENGLSSELQDSIRYYTARLTQAAGILLQLPQATVAQALVTLYRFWVVENMMAHEFSVRARLTHSMVLPTQTHANHLYLGRLSSLHIPHSQNLILPTLNAQYHKYLHLSALPALSAQDACQLPPFLHPAVRPRLPLRQRNCIRHLSNASP